MSGKKQLVFMMLFPAEDLRWHSMTMDEQRQKDDNWFYLKFNCFKEVSSPPLQTAGSHKLTTSL